MNEPTPLGAFPWESRAAAHTAIGFRLGGPTVEVILGYSDYGKQLLLMSFIHVLNNPLTSWRSIWVTRESAVEQADMLAGEAEAYIEDLGITVRPTENLDYDDFVEHIRLRVEGMFN